MRTLIALLVFLLTGCEKDEMLISPLDRCQNSGEIARCPSAIKLINDLPKCGACSISVVKGKYRGETVVFTMLTDPLCNGIFTGPIYNCKGGVATYISGSTGDQIHFHKAVSIDKILCSCDDPSLNPFDILVD